MELAQAAIPFVCSVAVSAAATPIVARVARALGVVDCPNERKVSRRANMPLLGGLAVALGVVAGIASLDVLDLGVSSKALWGFLTGGVLLIAVGAYDDAYNLSARVKLLAQIVAAFLAIYHGFLVDQIRNPFGGGNIEFPFWFAASVTTFWIVGVSNAMNLIDGLDGLSAGTGAIIGATLGFICWQADVVPGVMLSLVLVGALIGFLPYNFAPAKIFMGDTGALFLGYALALISIEGYEAGYRKASLMAFLVPLIALAVPLLDTLSSIVRRARAGLPIFAADRLHMHHRLLEVEGSDRGAVLSLYMLTGCFCVIAVSFYRLQGTTAFVFLVAVVALTLRLLRNMGVYSVDALRPSARSVERAKKNLAEEEA